MNIAIVAVAYNRIDSLCRLLNSLNNAFYDEQVPLIISIDKSETNTIEDFSDKFNWLHGKKTVSKHAVNLGLRNHMMSLGTWFEQYDALIILEDDIVVAPSFYQYAKATIEKYINSDKIAGISLYNFEVNYLNSRPFTPLKDEYDVYFMNCAMSWGQVWLKNTWQEFYNWYMNNTEFGYSPRIPKRLFDMGKNSWLKYHTRFCIENDKYFVYPYHSFTTNFGDQGMHNSRNSSLYQVSLQYGNISKFKLPEFGLNGTYYDEYFENKSLYQKVNLQESDCSIDLNGANNNLSKKRYWLTCKQANYKIIAKYALKYKPIEMNVIKELQGEGLFLYDTFQIQKNHFKKEPNVLLYFYKIYSIESFIRNYGIKKAIKNIIKHYIKRLKQLCCL